MRILAVDTSALTASAAVLEDDIIKGEITFTCALNHSQTIMVIIDNLLKGLSLKCNDIDLFACANGPGSFTGLRIGIGTVKGLAFGAGKPTVGVSTLKALAYNAPVCDMLIAPIMDARRAQVYNALYRFNNKNAVEEAPPRALDVAELAAELHEKTLFIGDGVSVYKNRLTELMGDNACFAPPNICLQSAASVALAALNEKPISCSALGAIYLRKPQAERERELSQRILSEHKVTEMKGTDEK